ncbi:MAG: cysteine--tRNA ligase [Candidatus Hydrogenedentota bacterium]
MTSAAVYSSLSRVAESLPDPPAPIGIYTCGVTPYDSPHLGHARAAVIFDAFTRFLRHRGNAVTYLRNITDIDDKIIERSGGEDVKSFAERYIGEYHAMVRALGCLPPDGEPRVTDHMPEIIALIGQLVANGTAYASRGSVYFSVRAFPRYGSLSGRNVDELLSGTRLDPGDEKQDPLDFALWKAEKPGEPSWSSPWGPGRPGWHIECSAMAMKYLGETIDIHGGGQDLIFPHHENELAQSEAATRKTFARIWMHNGLITLKSQKMSKSLGNVLSVTDLIRDHGSRVLRFYLLNAHFSSPLDFSEDRLRETKTALDRFATFPVGSVESTRAGQGPSAITHDFLAALEDNFNTARAFAVLFDAVAAGNRADAAARAGIAAEIRACGEIIGMELFPPRETDAGIERLIAERNAARVARDFRKSDEIRNLLSQKGVIIEDTAQGTRWRR